MTKTREPASALAADTPPADMPGEPVQRKRDRFWLLRQVALYLALFFGAALALGGASALAHQLGYDLGGSGFGRLLILGVYAAGAIGVLLRFGG